MLGSLKSVAHRLSRHPLRVVLILATVAIGIGSLVLCLDIGFTLERLVSDAFPRQGSRIVIANATLDPGGRTMPAKPPVFVPGDAAGLQQEYPALRSVTEIQNVPWDRIKAGDSIYQIRGVLGVGAAYASLMDLTMVVGSFFTADDVAAGRHVAVISAPVAKALFGSSAEAVGKPITSTLVDSSTIRSSLPGGALPRKLAMDADYTVVGVYAEPGEVERRAYGIPEMVVPSSATMPNSDMEIPWVQTFMARLVGDDVRVAAAKVTDILQRAHGADTAVSVWEGSWSQPESFLPDIRGTVTRVALFVGGLGVLVLVVSSFGIFSVMMVETVDRSREMGLRRAMGSTRGGVVGHLAGQAAWMSAFGAVAGIVLAAVFRVPLAAALAPYLSQAGVAIGDGLGPIPDLAAIGIALVAAPVSGALFALVPAAVAARRPIIDALRGE